MQYAANAQSGLTAGVGSALGGINVGNQVARQMPTLSSAIGKIDGVNTRLAEAIKQLAAIHDQIGGPRPLADGSIKGTSEPSGAVARLNGSADRAHDQLGELEGLISLVSRALG